MLPTLPTIDLEDASINGLFVLFEAYEAAEMAIQGVYNMPRAGQNERASDLLDDEMERCSRLTHRSRTRSERGALRIERKPGSDLRC